MEGAVPLQVFWNGSHQGEGEPARSLIEQLSVRGLLLEPFDRAVIGLREVYGTKETHELVDRDPAA